MGKEIVRLVPLVNTKEGVFCHLLEIGPAKIIVDCGIQDNFDYSIYAPVEEIIRSADCILITSFGLGHIGGLGYFSEQTAYASVPTTILGKIMLADVAHKLRSLCGREVFTAINPTQIKFSQQFQIKGVEISAYNAGYCVGNSIYRISYGLQTVVVGYNLNQRKENCLDGLAHENLANPAVFVTNSVYSGIAPYVLAARDEQLLSEIRKCAGRVVICVRFARLAELLSVIGNERALLVSKHGKLFVDRLSSMIEWANPQATEIFANLKISHGKVSEISDYKIIVVVEESLEYGVLGTILEKMNEPTNSLFLVGYDPKNLDFTKLNIYDIKYRLEARQTLPVLPTEADDADEEVKASADGWPNGRVAIFAGEPGVSFIFPARKRRVFDPDYGEAVKWSLAKKLKVSAKEAVQEEFEEIETFEFVKEGLSVAVTVKELHLTGVSDIQSSKAIIECIQPENVVIVNDNFIESPFYYAFVGGSWNAFFCNKGLEISTASQISKVVVSEKIAQQKHVIIQGKKVYRFLARREGGHLEVVGTGSPIVVGNVSLLRLKKSLLAKGFLVEVKGTTLLVGSRMNIYFENNDITLETDDSELLLNIRNVIYEFMICI